MAQWQCGMHGKFFNNDSAKAQHAQSNLADWFYEIKDKSTSNTGKWSGVSASAAGGGIGMGVSASGYVSGDANGNSFNAAINDATGNGRVHNAAGFNAAIQASTSSPINANGGVGNVPYGPPAPVGSSAGGGNGGGGGNRNTGSSSAPVSSGPTPWSVTINSGIPAGEVTTVLNKSLAGFNAQNGTDYALNSAGHIKNSSGGWMTQSQHDSFMGSIPVNAVDYKYNLAIDKAIAGDPGDMKNLDKFFTGAERPAIGYSPEYLQLERRAKAAGVSIEQQQANEAAAANPAPAPPAPAPVESQPEMSDPDPAPQPEASESAPAQPAETGDVTQPEESVSSAAAPEADADAEAALAVATEKRQSAREERLKKIADMRKPYQSGGASSGTGADSMVAPVVVPASQVPPPPIP